MWIEMEECVLGETRPGATLSRICHRLYLHINFSSQNFSHKQNVVGEGSVPSSCGGAIGPAYLRFAEPRTQDAARDPAMCFARERCPRRSKGMPEPRRSRAARLRDNKTARQIMESWVRCIGSDSRVPIGARGEGEHPPCGPKHLGGVDIVWRVIATHQDRICPSIRHARRPP